MSARTFEVSGSLDLALTLAPLRRGRGDPTMVIERNEVWWASRTPEGPATLHLEANDGRVEARSWGPGAAWALENAPRLAGCDDAPEALRAHHGIVRSLQRRYAGLRLGRSERVVEALIPTILEQKVTGKEARRSYRRLVLAYGSDAPGPRRLYLPPEPRVLAELPYYSFHPFGVERKRADVIRRSCANAVRLDEARALASFDAAERLMRIPGVGKWSAAEVTRLALGDADAVSVGDYHVPSLVTWALAGEPRGTDERMLELLEPYRGQRARVVRLLEVGAPRPPRFGPRVRLRSIETM